jgi:streptogramin lyase
MIEWGAVGFPGLNVGGVGGSGTSRTTYYVPTATPIVGPQLSGLASIHLPYPSHALDLIGAPDGTVWFTGSRYVGHVAQDGTVSNIYVRSGVFGMTTDARGTLWITALETNEVDAVTPSGVSLAYVIPTPNCEPMGITIGPDGNLWFTERASGKIGRVTPRGKFTEFLLPSTDSAPTSITVGADSNLWFTEQTGVIGRITVAGTITEFPVPGLKQPPLFPGDFSGPSADPESIISGPGGALWFTYANASAIGRMTLNGRYSIYTLPSPFFGADQIVSGGDGNVWFTDVSHQWVGRITPAGAVTEYALPAGHSDVWALAAGADETLWLSEADTRVIDKINLALIPK